MRGRRISRYSKFLVQAVKDAYLEAACENKNLATDNFEEFLNVVKSRVDDVIIGVNFTSGRFSKRGYSVLRKDVDNSRLMTRVFAEAVLSVRYNRENATFEDILCEVEGKLKLASAVESAND